MSRLIAMVALVVGASLAWAGAQPLDKSVEIRGLDRPERVYGQYIVVMKPETRLAELDAHQMARSAGGALMHEYKTALVGFSMRGSENAVRGLLNDPRVAWIEADSVVSLNQSVQSPVTWGLDRVDQRKLPLDNRYYYNFDGTGVDAYILDTGIRATHQDLFPRVVPAFTSINDGLGTDDCTGHGTHVAGTVGGTTYGVAKNVTLHAVRVLDCTGFGTISSVIAGVDFVTGDHNGIAVANMSLGGGASSALDTAVNNSVASGVFYAVAAGNDGLDACNTSPARAASAYTAAASDINDVGASFTNTGTCVDIFAPGVGITSASNASDTATATLNGTSMASPHVAGAAALLLDETPSMTPAQVANRLTATATPNVLTGIGAGSPNLLLYTLNEVPATPLTLDLQCEYLGRGRTECNAIVVGGVPPYSYEWDASAFYRLTNGDTTAVVFTTSCGWAWVRVTDSEGTRRTASDQAGSC